MKEMGNPLIIDISINKILKTVSYRSIPFSSTGFKPNYNNLIIEISPQNVYPLQNHDLKNI